LNLGHRKLNEGRCKGSNPLGVAVIIMIKYPKSQRMEAKVMQTQEPMQPNSLQETSLREQLRQEIESLPHELISEVLNFLLFTKAKLVKHQETSTIGSESPEQSYRPASGESLTDYQGGWAGDDMDCLYCTSTQSDSSFFG
jgi:hypothetical protein